MNFAYVKYRTVEGLKVAGVVIGLIAAIFVAFASFIGLFLITLACVVMLPSLVVASLSWFVWVYMEAGVTYFPDLPSVWLHIPFMHFWLVSALAVAAVRMIKRGFTVKSSTAKKPLTVSEKIAQELDRRSKLSK